MKRVLPFIVFLLLSCTSTGQDFINAQPVGGKQQLNYFINQELIYPAIMYSNHIEGIVSFHVTIDAKGHPSEIRDVLSPHPTALLEAIRIFKLIEWEPATLRSVPTIDTRLFEMEFNIKKYNRLCKQRGYNSIVNPYEPVDTSGKIFWYRSLDAVPYPVFLEKKENLANFIAFNLKYPEAAIKQNVTGVVKLSFVVETNGKISNLTIINSIGAGCNEEAIRVLRLLKWMPGIHDQHAVRTRTSFTVNFNLDREKNGLFNPVVKSSYGG